MRAANVSVGVGQDECKTNSVVYISPAHCGYVQVLPTETEVVEFPPPYQALPKLVFPYPTQWQPYPGASSQGLTDTTITICNWSGHDYWFSTGDSTDEVLLGSSTALPCPCCDPPTPLHSPALPSSLDALHRFAAVCCLSCLALLPCS